MMAAVVRYEVPARTPAKMCRGCDATIFWVTTAAGKPTPVNEDGTPHWATCPEAKSFRTAQAKTGTIPRDSSPARSGATPAPVLAPKAGSSTLARDAPAGSSVVVVLDDGTERRTLTRSAPWALTSGHWVVLLEGISGGYALERVRPAGAPP